MNFTYFGDLHQMTPTNFPILNYQLLPIKGALSCIIWTHTLQTTIKYVCVALRADNKGENFRIW